MGYNTSIDLPRRKPVSRCNKICAECARAQWAINGRYCFHLGMYVEYHKEPRCNRESKHVEQQ